MKKKKSKKESKNLKIEKKEKTNLIEELIIKESKKKKKKKHAKNDNPENNEHIEEPEVHQRVLSETEVEPEPEPELQLELESDSELEVEHETDTEPATEFEPTIIEEEDDDEEEETEPPAYAFDPLAYSSTISTDPKSLRKQQQHAYNGELLTHTYHTLPNDVKKFWKRRYKLFSKFDEGIYLNSELWYSVTPEETAIYIAELFKELLPNATKCCDVACGGGGNSIQFAYFFDYVVAIDINPINLYCTSHNSEIYGVRDHVITLNGDWNVLSQDDSWIPNEVIAAGTTGADDHNNKENGDDEIDECEFPEEELENEGNEDVDYNEEFFQIDENSEEHGDAVTGGATGAWSGEGTTRWNKEDEEKPFDFIFSSPPWGGVDYSRDGFDLESMPSFPLTKMLTQFKKFTNNIGLYLPKLSDLDQLEIATRKVFGMDAEYRLIHLGCAILALIGDELISKFDELEEEDYE